MASRRDCKNCIHYSLCNYEEICHYDSDNIKNAKDCSFFKDRSCFVELPCNVGDTVYVLHKQIVCDIVDGIDIEKFPDSSILYQIYCEKSRATYEFKDFGKIIFLTQEAAEQALKERESND